MLFTDLPVNVQNTVITKYSLLDCSVFIKRKKVQLDGKYSLESTDTRESEIRAHLRP